MPALPPNETTFLTISGVGVPPYSARGLTQTLEIIQGFAFLARDWNGNLIDFSNPNFRKYRTVITGKDQQPPAIDGIWPGLLVDIECNLEVSYKTGMVGAPGRAVVPGSSRVEGEFTFYRPKLTCRIVGFDQDVDDWAASVSWSLEAEEV